LHTVCIRNKVLTTKIEKWKFQKKREKSATIIKEFGVKKMRRSSGNTKLPTGRSERKNYRVKIDFKNQYFFAMDKKITVRDVEEALVIADALMFMIQYLNDNREKYPDPVMFNDTLKFVGALRVKYYKRALTKMWKDDQGNLQIENEN
jgi:hypothetical protein